MDRLQTLANNEDGVKAGANNKRVARIRQYDDEIVRLTALIEQTDVAMAKLYAGVIEGDFIQNHLVNACMKVLQTAHVERDRLVRERGTLARAVQR